MKITGHERERALLRNALRKERLPHALLFSGPEAVGKRLVALELAEELLCSRHGAESGATTQRAAFHRGEHPDLHVVTVEEERKEISIEQIRTLIDALQLSPYYGGQRVAIIDNAHLLSVAAQNALLLTLEEPPADCTLMLISHVPHRLLPTILSRAQEVAFGPLNDSHLREVLSALNASVPAELLPLLDGSLSALNLAELRTSPVASQLPEDSVRERLNSFEQTTSELSRLVREALHGESIGERLSRAAELADKSLSHEAVFRLIFLQLRREVKRAPTLENAEQWLRALDVERLIAQRNLNAVLQLSALLQ